MLGGARVPVLVLLEVVTVAVVVVVALELEGRGVRCFVCSWVSPPPLLSL